MDLETPQETLMSAVPSVGRYLDNFSLAAGSAGTKARVFYAYITDVDKKPVLIPHTWCYDKLTVASFRPAPTFSSEKTPSMVNSPALLEVGRTLSLSLHLKMFSHSQASQSYPFLHTLCRTYSQRSRQRHRRRASWIWTRGPYHQDDCASSRHPRLGPQGLHHRCWL